MAVICGDVSGHGPDAAALGAMLRVSWKALVLSGAGATTIVSTLREIVRRERRQEETFATVCLALIEAGPARVSLLTFGHPPPLLLDAHVTRVETVPLPPIGTVDMPMEDPVTVPLTGDWQLFFYTDGLIEGRASRVDERREGRLVEALQEATCSGLDQVAARAPDRRYRTRRRRSPSNDDVTVVVVGRARTGSPGARRRRGAPPTSRRRPRRAPPALGHHTHAGPCPAAGRLPSGASASGDLVEHRPAAPPPRTSPPAAPSPRRRGGGGELVVVSA